MKLALHILEATLYASVWIAALFIGLASLVLTGCGGSAHATPVKIEPPTIIVHYASPLVEEPSNRADVPPPVVRLTDTLTPPKAAVKIDANTYRACTCGDNCTCANCPSDCNLVARGDCPGGVCLLPQRSVIAKSSPIQASEGGACASGPVEKAKAVGGAIITVGKAIIGRERRQERRANRRGGG